jgi:glycerol-1-phosphate dehydrogenase [NAD(P)+]
MKAYEHRITIPAILEVGMERMNKVGAYLTKTGITKIVIFFGGGIRELFGGMVLDSISKQPSLRLLEQYDFDDIRFEAVMDRAFTLPGETETVVGVGGGKILDVAK